MKLEQGAGSGEHGAGAGHSVSVSRVSSQNGDTTPSAPRSQLPAPCSPLTAFLEEVP
jgi:hypothetical protein